MAKNLSGTEYVMYVATAVPTIKSSALDIAYSLLGKGTGLSLSRSRGTIDVSTKDDVDNSAFIAGRRNQTVQFNGLFDHTEDNGYTKASDAYESESGVVHILATSTTSGDTEWYGSGIVTDLSVDFGDQAASTFSLTVQFTGAVTEATGTST